MMICWSDNESKMILEPVIIISFSGGRGVHLKVGGGGGGLGLGIGASIVNYM